MSYVSTAAQGVAAAAAASLIFANAALAETPNVPLVRPKFAISHMSMVLARRRRGANRKKETRREPCKKETRRALQKGD